MPLIADLETMVPHLRDNLEQSPCGACRVQLEFDPAPSCEEAPRTQAPAKQGCALGRNRTVVRGERARERRPRSARDRRGRSRRNGSCVHPRRDVAPRLRAGGRRRSPAASTPRSPRISRRARSAPKNVIGVRMPYRTSSPESLEHAQLVIDALGIEARTLDISAAVDGYLAASPTPTRRVAAT